MRYLYQWSVLKEIVKLVVRAWLPSRWQNQHALILRPDQPLCHSEIYYTEVGISTCMTVATIIMMLIECNVVDELLMNYQRLSAGCSAKDEIVLRSAIEAKTPPGISNFRNWTHSKRVVPDPLPSGKVKPLLVDTALIVGSIHQNSRNFLNKLTSRCCYS